MSRILTALVFATLCWAEASAQTDYPNRPVRIVVPSAPGGGTDIVSRVLAQHLSTKFGQQFFVENRAGAGQMIGIEYTAASPPDGYTLLMSASTLALNPAMYKRVKYDAVHDFAPITQVAALPNVLVVNASLPVHSVGEFIAKAKAEPGRMTYASAGIGTSPHMSMELFKSMAGIDVLHVPYKGTTPGVTDLLAGTVNAMMVNVLTAKSHIATGSLRALGVTGLTRLEALPDVPTITEAGVPNYEALNWYGLLAPAGTPATIVDMLQAEIAVALRRPEIKERLAADGAEPVGSTPTEFSARIKDELVKWAAVARAAKIEPQ